MRHARLLVLSGLALTCLCFETESRNRVTYVDDFTKSEVIIVGRVVNVRQVEVSSEKDRGAGWRVFGYVAEIRVGAGLKGNKKSGDQVLLYLGDYRQKEVDDVTPNPYFLNFDEDGLHLDVNQVYLLYLNESRGTDPLQYEPRSGRWSIYKVTEVTMEAGRRIDVSKTHVSPLVDHSQDLLLQSVLQTTSNGAFQKTGSLRLLCQSTETRRTKGTKGQSTSTPGVPRPRIRDRMQRPLHSW